jgi:hypothetical protein
VIGLLIEKHVTYTEVEADALVAKAKSLAKESGRSVRAEAELLLRDRETRLRDLRNKAVEANKLLAAIAVEVDDLRADSGDDDDGDLAAIMATMATSCEPFTSVSTGGSASTTKPGDSSASSATTVAPGPIESVKSPPL